MATHQFPGPDEEGLAFMRETTLKFPRAAGVWLGPLEPLLVTRHSETVRHIVTTAGTYSYITATFVIVGPPHTHTHPTVSRVASLPGATALGISIMAI